MAPKHIKQLEETGDLSEKEITEKLLRLNDVYGLIYGSRIATFDFKSALSFFSQMMLPLLDCYWRTMKNCWLCYGRYAPVNPVGFPL